MSRPWRVSIMTSKKNGAGPRWRWIMLSLRTNSWNLLLSITQNMFKWYFFKGWNRFTLLYFIFILWNIYEGFVARAIQSIIVWMLGKLLTPIVVLKDGRHDMMLSFHRLNDVIYKASSFKPCLASKAVWRQTQDVWRQTQEKIV